MVLLLPVLFGIAASIVGLIDGATIQYYASKYDHLDIDTILNNRRMVAYYAACLLSKGPCPPEGMEFKHILPEALRTNCLRCTEKQKTVTLRVLRRLKKEYPKIWAQLSEQWDPDGLYIEKFESGFSGTQTAAQPSIQVQNRFGDEEKKNKGTVTELNQISTKTTTTSSSTTAKSTATKTPSTSTTSRPSTAAASTKININTITVTSTKPTQKPRPNLAASIQATVSLGPQIVGEFVRGLGALGTRVVETGAEIAGVVLKNIARPL